MPHKNGKTHLLRVTGIDTVGFVDRGANPGSHVLLLKRLKPDPGNGGGGKNSVGASDPALSKGGKMKLTDRILAAFGKTLEGMNLEEGGMDFDISKLPEDAKKAFQGLEAQRAEAVEKAEGLETANGELTTELKTAQAAIAEGEGSEGEGSEGEGSEGEGDGTSGDGILKGASPELREYIQKVEARAEEAIVKAEIEADARRTSDIEKRLTKGGDLAFLPGDTCDRVAVLKAANALPEEAQKSLETVLKAAAEQVKQGGLFKAFGSDHEGTEGDGAYEKMENIAKKIMAEDGVSFSKALEMASTRHPDLAREYAEEVV